MSKTIYIDSDFHCHVAPAEDRREVIVDCFDEADDEEIERNRFVPAGESWTRPDGVVFHGEMLARW